MRFWPIFWFVASIAFAATLYNVTVLQSRAPDLTVALEAAPQSASAANSADAPLDARIHLLARGLAEPQALYHGYMLIGPNAPADRKRAVARAAACALDLAPSDARAADRIGLVSFLSRRSAERGAQTVSPGDLINDYDFPRARRWLLALEALDPAIDPDTAVVFVGADASLVRDFDQGGPLTIDQESFVVADATLLTPRYLEAWVDDVISGVRTGVVQGRQDMQFLMETHSWIETIGAPLAAVLRLAPQQAVAAPQVTCL